MADQFLAREDRDAAAVVETALSRDGVDVRLATTLTRVEVTSGGKVLHLEAPDGEGTIAVDEILVGVGRRPNVEDLGLDAAGVEATRDGVVVDDHLRTSNRRVFASGDVCLPHKFTHSADAASRAVVQNALFPGPKKRFSKLVVPWCTYTDPEIAHVGVTEREARARGLEIETVTIPWAEVDRALAEGDEDGFLKVHIERNGDTILGATVVGRHGGDLISEITTAMVAGKGLGWFAGVIHPYPTLAEAIRKAADAYNRTRLTPFTTKLLQRWFRWTR
jgi:pyruvate/2-oxoglutarate dehydrogenase complex dihydrolipoamide dehydrogenase (E3) component